MLIQAATSDTFCNVLWSWDRQKYGRWLGYGLMTDIAFRMALSFKPCCLIGVLVCPDVVIWQFYDVFPFSLEWSVKCPYPCLNVRNPNLDIVSKWRARVNTLMEYSFCCWCKSCVSSKIQINNRRRMEKPTRQGNVESI